MWGDNHVRVMEPSKDCGHQGSGASLAGSIPPGYDMLLHVVTGRC